MFCFGQVFEHFIEHLYRCYLDIVKVLDFLRVWKVYSSNHLLRIIVIDVLNIEVVWSEIVFSPFFTTEATSLENIIRHILWTYWKPIQPFISYRLILFNVRAFQATFLVENFAENIIKDKFIRFGVH